MLRWLRRGLGESRSGMSAAIGALDEVVNPGAARGRELVDAEHERVAATPSPGDKILRDGAVVIPAPGPRCTQ